MDSEEIKKRGIKIIEEFSKELASIEETDETHYVVDLKNVTRQDNKPLKKDFRERLQRLAPKWEDGYVSV